MIYGWVGATYDVLQVLPCYSVEVFIFGGEDFAVDGCEGEGRVIEVNVVFCEISGVLVHVWRKWL